MLELINVRKTYTTQAGETVAMNGINLKFPKNGMVFVTGKSGSGKTTLLNVVGGLDNFDSGEIVIDGKKFSTFTEAEYDSYRNTFVGFIFQEYNLLPDYTVEKNIKIANELQGKETPIEKINALLEEFDIAGLNHRKTSQLSGGQKQRVAIVRSLVKDPKIIMADEPTGALDSVTGIQVMETLKKLSKDKLILVVSHDLELAEQYADRIIRLIDGSVVEDITISDKNIESNIYVDNDDVTVRAGSELNPNETLELVKAIREKKKVNITEKFNIRQRQKTDESKIVMESNTTELINSKMKYKSAAELGLKSLSVKPGRLIITIILSVIAFAVFGLFDTIAAYNDSRAISNLLKKSDYDAISINKTYISDNYDNGKVRLTDADIEYYRTQSGYEFRPVYDINDKTYASVSSKYQIADMSVGSVGASSTGSKYFIPQVTGFVEFNNDEIKYDANGAPAVIDESGFNLKLVKGDFPKIKLNSQGVVIEGNLKEVAISKYLAETIAYWRHGISLPEKVLGETFQVYESNFQIVGIYDCGTIPSKYDSLKIKEVTNSSDPLAEDLKTHLNSGLYFNIFVPQGYMKALIAKNNRIQGQFSGDKSYEANIVREAVYNPLKIGTNAKFFKDADVKIDNVMLFDNPTNVMNGYALKDDEVLINLYYIEALFDDERNTIGKDVANNGVGVGDKYNEIMALFRSSLKKTEIDPTMRERMAELISYVKQAHTKMAGEWNHIKNLEIVTKDGNKSVATKTFKIVGVYSGIDLDTGTPPTKTMAPLVMSAGGLESLEIFTDQGLYGRMIAPLSSNNKGAKFLSKQMSKDSGVNLAWYGNSILDTLKTNGEMITQFAQLFLYVSLILALFSIFMLYNYISASIVSKRQSIGVLRALGSGSKDIFLMFITESIVIAVINGIIASVVAGVSCIFVNMYIKEIMHLVIDFALFGVRQVLFINLASILTATVSSLIPIIKIAKEKPVKLIREP